MLTKPTIVFTPGAWHGPDCFRLVRDVLHKRGWETEGVTYPSVCAEPPNKGLTEDAAAVRAVLERLVEQGKQVVLVTHSYGGVVCSSAVHGLGYQQRSQEGKKGGVITLLFVTAFVIGKGQTLKELFPGGDWLPWFRFEGDKVYVKTPEHILYHDVPADLQKQAIETLATSHECPRAWTDKLDHEGWRDVHSLYFLCEEDRAIPLPLQEQMAQALGPDSVVFRSQASHSPFLSAVDDVVQGVEKAVQSGLEKVV